MVEICSEYDFKCSRCGHEETKEVVIDYEPDSNWYDLD